jgi:hypothetical protein
VNVGKVEQPQHASTVPRHAWLAVERGLPTQFLMAAKPRNCTRDGDAGGQWATNYRGSPAFGAMKTISASARRVSASRDLAQT